MTLLELQTELARETNNNPDTLAPATKSRYLAALNRHYRRIVSWPGVQHLRDTTTTFTSVVGQATYAIPNAAKVNRIMDTANRHILQPMTLAQYRWMDPDPSTQLGVSSFWIWKGYSGTGGAQTVDVILWQTPSDVLTYTADITAQLTPLAANNDVPILPPDFHDLLYLGALEDEYRHLDDARLMVVAQSRQQREAQLKYWLHETAAGSTVVVGRMPSQLGAWFPAGT